MGQYSHKRIIKVSIVISLMAAALVFVAAMNVLKYAHTENAEYAKWDSLSLEDKSLKNADGQPVHPEPAKHRSLTQNERLILSLGLALFAPLTVFPVNYLLFRRGQKDRLS